MKPKVLTLFLAVLFLLPKAYGSAQVMNQPIKSINHVVRLDSFPVIDDHGVELVILAYHGMGANSSRPIVFAFNGGPGSSSAWLHLGLLGPKRVRFPSKHSDFSHKEFNLVDNPYSLLSVADLVFIDPPGTGFSYSDNGREKEYWNLTSDADAISHLIYQYVKKYKRWNRPLYLLAESYGTIRIPLILERLQSTDYLLHIDGVILISPAMDVSTFIYAEGNPVAYATALPTYAELARLHNKVNTENLNNECKHFNEFALSRYLPAIVKGNRLSSNEKNSIASIVSRCTGLSKTFILNNQLKISVDDFATELLKKEGKILSILDGRFTSNCQHPDTGQCTDSAFNTVSKAYAALLNLHLESTFEDVPTKNYIFMNMEANNVWQRSKRYSQWWSGYINTLPLLQKSLEVNPELRIFVATGLFDLGTTFLATESMLSQLKTGKGQLVYKKYPAGHMMYFDERTLQEINSDLKAFIHQENDALHNHDLK